MRLRQKLFAAILAVMVVVFLLLALASFMNALDAQVEVEKRLEAAVLREFRRVARSGDEKAVAAFERSLHGFLPAYTWTVASGERDAGGEPMAREGDYRLYRSGVRARGAPVGWLSGIFWAVAAGTALLMLVVYGLLLRLVLRPVENLVVASRTLSKGVRPAKVSGEARTDEMGELVRAFNSMADEVVRGRNALQELVEKATADYKRAHERLVLEQRLSATGKLAAGVAHEISNPLGGMINAARAIEKEPELSPRAREYVGLLNEGLERVRTIDERMRAFVRPKPAVGPVDLAEAVKGAVSFARHRIGDENVALDEEYPDTPVRTVGDSGELQQVFLNLVMNALDAMRASGENQLHIRVARLSADAQAGEEPRAVAEVTDTGAGMDAEQLAGAFDLFYSTKGEGGTGLGLAIAHRIVTDHGGEIELESSPGRGTTARVRLPLAEDGR